uniref:Uncharacterized protein n=1 Tax=Tetraselmis sp. GSL018 TaxID=582737 RepID=A0A061S1N3_9CHLO
MSTAGKYIGAYRIPVTEELKTVLQEIHSGKYYDQDLRDEASLFLESDKIPYTAVLRFCTAVRYRAPVFNI